MWSANLHVVDLAYGMVGMATLGLSVFCPSLRSPRAMDVTQHIGLLC